MMKAAVDLVSRPRPLLVRVVLCTGLRYIGTLLRFTLSRQRIGCIEFYPALGTVKSHIADGC
jgi:hypothetical protein